MILILNAVSNHRREHPYSLKEQIGSVTKTWADSRKSQQLTDISVEQRKIRGAGALSEAAGGESIRKRERGPRTQGKGCEHLRTHKHLTPNICGSRYQEVPLREQAVTQQWLKGPQSGEKKSNMPRPQRIAANTVLLLRNTKRKCLSASGL